MNGGMSYLTLSVIGVFAILGCESVADSEIDINDKHSSQATVEIQSSHGSSVIVVYPDNQKGWNFLTETGDGTGEFVQGPDAPPYGSGSVRFLLDDGSDGVIIGKTDYLGTRLDELTSLEYSTYRTTGGSALAASLQFNIDDDLTDADESWKGRLVFEPYYSETVETGQWQAWNAITQGQWWATGSPINSVCSQGDACTFDEVLSAFPDAGIHGSLGAVLFKAGSGWAGFDGNVDGFTIGINGHDQTFDFEAKAPNPVTKDDCKNGGWEEYGFKNQGQCIRFVNTGKDSR